MSASPARLILRRCDDLARITAEPGQLTRTFASPAMRRANGLVGGQERRIGSAVLVGFGGRDERAVVAVEQPQLDLHTLCRAAMSDIQDVSTEFGRHVSWKLNRLDAVPQS